MFSYSLEKDPDAGNDWGQEEKGMTEDERVRWHHQLDGHEREQTWGDSEGQEHLAHGSHRVRKSWHISGLSFLFSP